MEFRFTPQQEALRREIQDWLKAVMPRFQVGRDFVGISEVEDEDTRYSPAFSRELGKKGWVGVAWPKEFGGKGWGFVEQMILKEELALARAPCGYHIVGENQMGPSILVFGTDEQKAFFIPRILSGEAGFAIGYTEPNTGSDLAGLTTHARRDGDDYIVNGQKMWAGGSQFVDYLWTAVRTDPEAPKHRGVSIFIIPLKGTPGLTIRPYYTMGGGRYNEIFFHEVRIPASMMVGEKDRGWYTAAHNLDFERSGGAGRQGEAALQELIEVAKTLRSDGRPLLSNPIVRQRLAQMAIEMRVARNLGWRVVSLQARGRVPTMETSMSKVFGTEVTQRFARLAVEVLGLYGALERDSKYAIHRGKFPRRYQSTISRTIAGGTSEINRNIMATRGLGLPRG